MLMQFLKLGLAIAKRLRWILGAIPAVVYGVAYLLCIPAFGVAYLQMPRSFYQSTIKTENAYTAQATVILAGICRAIAMRLPEAPEGRNVDLSKFAVDVDGYSFGPGTDDMRCDRTLITEDDRLGFKITVDLRRKKACPSVLTAPCEDVARIPFLVTLDPFDMKETEPELVSFDPPMRQFSHPLEFVTRRVANSSEKSQLTAALANRLFGRDPPALYVDEDFDTDLNKFMQASNGFTSDAGDNCARMMYFSATTITTLGFGDIVPITPRARQLVTFEAVLGVVLIGLFLNSLASRPQDGHRPTGPTGTV